MFADFPPSMSAAELVAAQAQGFEVVPTDLQPQTRPEWGMWECIRELVQNALDETERFTLQDTPDGVIVADQGNGFGVHAFLLGGSPDKPKPKWQRGRFGEGMKLGALACLRKGYGFSFESVGIEGAATIAARRLLGEEITVMQWLLRRNRNPVGSRFLLRGWHETFASSFWRHAAAWAQVPSKLFPGPPASPYRRWQAVYAGKSGLDQGTNLPRTEQMAGYIFARDILMTKRETALTYNLWDFDMAPDRHGPASEYDLRYAIGNFWAGVTLVPMMRYLLRTIAAATSGKIPRETIEHEMAFTSSAARQLKENAVLWQQAWHLELPKSVITTRPGLEQRLIHEGYQSISFPLHPWEELLPTDISTIKSQGLVLGQGTVLVAETDLTRNERTVRDLLQMVTNQLTMDTGVELRHRGEIPTLRVVTFLNETVEGTYDPVTGQINLSRALSGKFFRSLDVVIHEYAHYTSQAADGSEAHTSAISLVGAAIAQLIALRRLPEEWYDGMRSLGYPA